MIANLRETTRAQRRAGLAEHEPRAVQRHDAGPARPADGLAPDHDRADAARRRAARRVLHRRGATTTTPTLRLIASYGYKQRKNVVEPLRSSARALVGQAALEKQVDPAHRARRTTTSQIASGLGEARAAQHHRPAGALRGPGDGGDRARVVPAVHRGPPDVPRPARRDDRRRAQHDQATMRTEELLQQSQGADAGAAEQSEELQSQQEELKRSNAELEQQAQTLQGVRGAARRSSRKSCSRSTRSSRRRRSCSPSRTAASSSKNREVELARAALEEKAEQLALSSKYKSEFLANMSHELRTPLNSLLILAKLLVGQQGREPHRRSRSSSRRRSTARARDLLKLINDILDLSKVEAGKMDVHAERRAARRRRATTSSARFRPVAEQKGARASTSSVDAERAADDRHRRAAAAAGAQEPALERVQVHRDGRRRRCASRARRRTAQFATPRARRSADTVIAFAVTDTGIGIPKDKQQLIFEAFQQADGTTQPQVRRHGPRPLDQPRDRAPARRRDPRRVDAGRGQHVHALPAGDVVPRRRREHGDARGALDRLVARGRALAPSDGDARPGRCAELDPTLLLAERRRRRPRATIERGDRVVLIVEDDADLRADRCSRWRASRASRASSRCAATRASRSRTSTSPTRSCSTSSCRAWTAGRCSTGSSTTRETRHIPVHIISGDRRAAARALRAGARRVPREAGRRRRRSTTRSRKIATFIDSAVKRLLVVEDDDDAARQHRRADRRRRRRDHGGRLGRGGARELDASALRLHGARPEAAGDERLRAARDRSRATSAAATCRSSSTRARS